ncbi:MAG TPA: hypothetical protein VHZ27_18405 [Solirubrobacteraceae bacterium]|nr:hypothetical protein [Solirubrobacteraceae bacterium]
MDTARDLACADVWQASLERSLARRGKSTRSSLELFHLRPERDLSCVDILRESSAFSEMRRSAAARRPAMSLPGAGGISALALLAAATLPGLIGGRGGSARAARITYHADVNGSGLPKTAAPRVAAAPSAAAKAATVPGTTTAAVAGAPAAGTSASGVLAAAAHASPPAVRSTRPELHSARPATVAHTAHIAAAHDAAVSAGGAPVSRSVSGGAAPAVQRSVAAASTVRHAAPAVHKVAAVHSVSATHGVATHGVATHGVATHGVATHRVAAVHRVSANHNAPAVNRITPGTSHPPAAAKTHATTGGGAIEEATSVGHPRTTATPTKPQTPAHPKPTTQTVAKPHPVATTPPARKPAPAPTIAPGHYVNPLAGASVTPERIDQGVDYSGSGTLGAIGAGKVTYVATSGTGWPGAFIEYQLSDGADSGRYVYYAEGVSPAAGLHVGETLTPGQPVAQIIAGSSSGIEIGWGSGVGTQPLAQALGQWSSGSDSGNYASPAGKDFSSLIAQLGGPPGKVEG